MKRNLIYLFKQANEQIEEFKERISSNDKLKKGEKEILIDLIEKEYPLCGLTLGSALESQELYNILKELIANNIISVDEYNKNRIKEFAVYIYDDFNDFEKVFDLLGPIIDENFVKQVLISIISKEKISKEQALDLIPRLTAYVKQRDNVQKKLFNFINKKYKAIYLSNEEKIDIILHDLFQQDFPFNHISKIKNYIEDKIKEFFPLEDNLNAYEFFEKYQYEIESFTPAGLIPSLSLVHFLERTSIADYASKFLIMKFPHYLDETDINQLIKVVVRYKPHIESAYDDLIYEIMRDEDEEDKRLKEKRYLQKAKKLNENIGEVFQEYIYAHVDKIKDSVKNSIGSLDFLHGKAGTITKQMFPTWFEDIFEKHNVEPINSIEYSWKNGIINEIIQTTSGEKQRQLRVGKFLKKINATNEQIKEFETRNIAKEDNEYNWIIKTDPKSVLTMSFQQNWTSCMRPGGAYELGPLADAKVGSAIIYFYKNNEEKPCGREIIRPALDKNNNPFILRSYKIYGEGILIPDEDISTSVPVKRNVDFQHRSDCFYQGGYGLKNDKDYAYLDNARDKTPSYRSLIDFRNAFEKLNDKETESTKIRETLKKELKQIEMDLENKPKPKPKQETMPIENKYDQITNQLFPDMGYADDNVIANALNNILKQALAHPKFK